MEWQFFKAVRGWHLVVLRGWGREREETIWNREKQSISEIFLNSVLLLFFRKRSEQEASTVLITAQKLASLEARKLEFTHNDEQKSSQKANQLLWVGDSDKL